MDEIDHIVPCIRKPHGGHGKLPVLCVQDYLERFQIAPVPKLVGIKSSNLDRR